jgi:hypothetical protein
MSMHVIFAASRSLTFLMVIGDGIVVNVDVDVDVNADVDVDVDSREISHILLFHIG